MNGWRCVPLDPGYPRERLNYILGDAVPTLLLADARGLQVLDTPPVPVIPLDDLAALTDGLPEDNLAPASLSLSERHLAYVIYTSGSSGQPKGVMNEHSGIVNRLGWMQERYGLTAGDAVLQKTSFSFDVSVWEFFWLLITGVMLVMAWPLGHRDPAYLSQVIADAGITTLHFVHSMLSEFLASDSGSTAVMHIKRVICSGEALPLPTVQLFHRLLPDVELHVNTD